MQIVSIAIIGTGVIGSSWAAFYASKGFQVKMWDVDADLCQKGHQQAVDTIELLQAQGILSGDRVAESMSRIETTSGLEQAVENVQLVQESVAENYEIKQQVFQALDAHTGADVIGQPCRRMLKACWSTV